MSDSNSTGRPTKPPFQLLRGIALQIALLVATLAAAEVVFRIVDFRELRSGYGEGYPLVHRHDAELGWLPIANSSGLFFGTRTVSVRHNRLGLRDAEPGPHDRPTVLFIGDSFVWGYDVEAEQRFTDLLRRDMPGIQIVNAGVNGYGTDQQNLLLARIWSAYRPEVVVLMFCVDNDRSDNSTNVRSDGYYKSYLERSADGSWQFAGQPVPKSRQVYFTDNFLVRNLWLARAAVTAYVRIRHPKIDVADPTEQLVGMMRDFVESRGARFLVGLQRRERPLEAFLKTQNIPYASLGEVQRHRGTDFHWNAQGHAIVAERLASFLIDSGAVDPAQKQARRGN